MSWQGYEDSYLNLMVTNLNNVRVLVTSALSLAEMKDKEISQIDSSSQVNNITT